MGDDSLVDRLYQRYAPALFAFLCRYTATREDAEDLLVDVFLTAMEETVLVDLAEKQQVAWLWRVARNKAINMYRHAARHPKLELEQSIAELNQDEARSLEETALLQEEYQRLVGLLKSLSPLQQEVVRLRFAHDLQCTEIAEVLGKKPGTVRVLLMRTLRLLHSVYASSTVE